MDNTIKKPEDREMVQAITAVLLSKYNYLYVNGDLYVQDDGVYRSLEDHQLSAQMQIFLGEAGVRDEWMSSFIRREVEDNIKSRCARTAAQVAAVSDLYDVAFLNGYVNMKDYVGTGVMRLLPFSPHKIFFSKIPHNLQVTSEADAVRMLEASAPVAYKFMADLVGPQNVLLQLQKIGYCFYRSNPFKRMFLDIGGADAGKTTFVTLLQNVLGHSNTVSITMQDMVYRQFSLSMLHNKLANLCDDLPDTEVQHLGIIKMLTGDSPISADRKHKDRIEFASYAKPFFFANRLPHLKDSSDSAFFSRCVVTNYPNRFARDDRFKEGLYTESNYEAVACASVIALRQLFMRGGFLETPGVREAWVSAINTAYRYIVSALGAGALVRGPWRSVEKERLYNAYLDFMDAEEETAADKAAFTKTMASHFNCPVKQFMEGGRRFYAYAGIGFPDAQKGVSMPQTKIQGGMPPKADNAATASVAQPEPICATCPDCHTTQPMPPDGRWNEWGSRKCCDDCLDKIRNPDKYTDKDGVDIAGRGEKE